MLCTLLFTVVTIIVLLHQARVSTWIMILVYTKKKIVAATCRHLSNLLVLPKPSQNILENFQRRILFFFPSGPTLPSESTLSFQKKKKEFLIVNTSNVPPLPFPISPPHWPRSFFLSNHALVPPNLPLSVASIASYTYCPSVLITPCLSPPPYCTRRLLS